MRVGVIGLGNFGMNVARELFRQGWDVLAMDKDPEKVQNSLTYAARTAVADCTDGHSMEDLGFGRMEAVIVSMGENLAAAILATLYLKELGVKTVIVKAHAQDHKKLLVKVGASKVIFPEMEMAVKVVKSLALPDILDYLPLTEESAVVELTPPREFAGKSLAELDLRKRFHVSVIGFKNTETGSVRLALAPSERIGAHDLLVVLGKQKDIARMQGKSRDAAAGKGAR